MKDRLPVTRTLGTALAATLALAACTGSADKGTLADGRNDASSASSGATNVGPSSPPVDSAGPGSSDVITQPSGDTAATLMLAPQGPHGPHITNAAGNALYYVEGDTDGSKCTGPCLQAWPPVTLESQQPTGTPGLEGAKITTITRAEGMQQVVFDGHPLYRYAADASAGSTNGDGIKDKFGSWHLATPATSGVTAPAAAKGSSTGG